MKRLPTDLVASASRPAVGGNLFNRKGGSIAHNHPHLISHPDNVMT